MVDFRDRIDAVVPRTLSDLKTLVAVESISSMPDHAADVRRSAEQVATWLTELGCPQVSIVAEGGQPAVVAHFPAPAGKPTICLYAHHDVQPVGDLGAWSSAPFEAVERDGRLYGRGTADDKGGVLAHLAALRAYDGKPPIGVKLFIEGEEEIGSPSLPRILAAHHDELDADAFVIADSTNWEVGVPTFTTTLRGIVDCVVEVRTLSHGVHSGFAGGVVPDALTALARILATLHDDEGNVAVEGLVRTPGPDLDYPPDRLAEETGLLPGVHQIGRGSVVERMWTAPAVSVLAIDAPPVAEAVNLIIPAARAKVSLRLAPGDDAGRALAALTAHLESHAPWGAQVRVIPGDSGQPGVIPASGPVFEEARAAIADAWGREPVFAGAGGSIPMTAEFQRQFPTATVLVTAVADSDSRPHGVDESLDLGDWRKAALFEMLFMERMANLKTEGGRPPYPPHDPVASDLRSEA